MGSMSPSDMAQLRISSLSHMHSIAPQLRKPDQASVIARKRLCHYFENQILQAPHIFYEDPALEEFDLYTGTLNSYSDDGKSKDFRIYRADTDLKRKIWLP